MSYATKTTGGTSGGGKPPPPKPPAPKPPKAPDAPDHGVPGVVVPAGSHKPAKSHAEDTDGYLIVGFIILAILLVIFIALFSKWSD